MQAWLYLTAAIVFEIAGTLLLKLSDGFEKGLWGFLSLACYTVCFWLFAQALRFIPVGVAYAVWAGVGMVAVAVLGVALFGDRLSAPQLGFISLVVVGAVGLRLTTGA